VALHLERWCFHASGIWCIFWQTLLYLDTLLARRIHFARSWHVYGILHSVLHRVMHDISIWSLWLLPLGHIFIVIRQHRLGRGTGHPTSGNEFDAWVSSCPPLVQHILQLYSSQYLHTMGLSPLLWGVCHPLDSH
jgi:hypothetical protein